MVRDACGNVLAEGDHDIDCRIEGIGAMGLESEFVRKAWFPAPLPPSLPAPLALFILAEGHGHRHDRRAPARL